MAYEGVAYEACVARRLLSCPSSLSRCSSSLVTLAAELSRRACSSACALALASVVARCSASTVLRSSPRVAFHRSLGGGSCARPAALGLPASAAACSMAEGVGYGECSLV